MLTAAQCLEGFDQLWLSDEARALFLAENAIRVFTRRFKSEVQQGSIDGMAE
jgi:hypothetical protein